MANLTPITFYTKTGKEITLRSPQPGEGAALLATVRRIMATSDHLLTQADEFNYTEEQEESMIKRHLEHADKMVIVVETDGQLVGMLDFSVGPKRRGAHVGDLGMSLLPELRGIGVGTRLLKTLLDWARQNPRIEKVKLSVHAKNTAGVKLYQNLGFKEEGRCVRGAKLAEGVYDDVLTMSCFVK